MLPKTLIITLLSARFAFWNTWDAWRLNKYLSSRAGGGVNISFLPGYLERKSKNLSNAIQLYQVDTLTYRHTLLTVLSALKEQERVSILDILTENRIHITKTYLKKQKNEFQGAFFNLLRFYHKLCKTEHIGMIKSAQLNSLGRQEREKL